MEFEMPTFSTLTNKKNIRVLLVEDDRVDAALTRDLLADIPFAHYELEWVATAEEGLERLRRNEHDACLLDYYLGKTSGLDVLQALAGGGCRVPVILLTGQGSLDVDRAAMRAGAMDFLEKGAITPDLLERTIRHAIERREGEEALRASEERLSLATEASGSGYWDWDLRQNQFTWSERTCELLGLPVGSKPDYPLFLKALYPEDRERTEAAMVQAITQHKSYDIEYRVVWPDGGVHWLYDKGRAIYDEAGQPLRMAGMVMEITARKAQEQALRESVQRFRGTFENAAVGISHMDSNGRWLSVNQKLCDILGYSREELLQANFLFITHPDEREAEAERYNQLMNGEIESYATEKRFVRRDGQVAWLHVTRALQRDETGHPLYSISMVQDISDRKRTEDALRESEAFGRSVLNSMPAHVVVLDRQGTVIQVNEEWKRFARDNGAADPERAYLGENYLEVCRRAMISGLPSAEGAGECLAQLQALLSGAIDRFDLEYPCHSPWERRWFLMRAAPLSELEGGIVISHINISERKRAEDALAESDNRFRAFMDNSPALAWMKDESGRYVYVNKPFERQFGPWLQDWCEKTDFDLWPEDAQRLRDNDLAVLTSGQAIEQTEETVSPNGEHDYWWNFKFPVQDAMGGKYVGGVGVNITERKRAEALLRESEELRRLALEAAAQGTWDWNLLRGEVHWDNRTREIFAVSSGAMKYEQVIGTLIHPKDRRRVEAAVQRALDPASGGAYDTEFRVVWDHDGSVHWVASKGRAFYQGEGSARRAVRFVGTVMNIDARKQAEEQLRRQAKMLDLAPVLVRDLDDSIMIWNRGMEKLYGWSAEEARGQVSHDLFQTRFPQPLEEIQARLRETGHWEGELRHIRRDGTSITVASLWMLYRDSQDTPVAIIEVNNDITATKQAEAALRESAQRLRATFDNAAVGIVEIDAEDRFVAVNDRMCQILGYRCEELLGLSVHELTYPEDRPRSEEMNALLHEGGIERIDYEKRYLKSDGSPLWVHVTVSAIRDDAGRFQRAIGTVEDIAERILAEEKLRAGEERYRALIHASANVLYRMNPDWSEMIQLQGGGFIADLEQPSHAWLQEYIPPGDQPMVIAAIGKAVSSGSVFELEHRVRRTDGTYGWSLSRAVPLRDATGEIVEWFGAATDITDRKKAEEALREANERLAEADRRKDEFLAMLAHELRNPLAPIRNAVQVLRMTSPADPTAQRQKDVIDRQVTHMVRLVDDLLDVSRITRGRITLQKEEVVVCEIVARALETVQPLIESRRHQLHVSMPERPLHVEADPVRLAQVVANLLNNAAKYTDEGGQIWLQVTREAQQAVVKVRDTGTGIRSEVLSSLFDLFTQAERSLDRAQGGLGIGLYLVRRLVEMHGGCVQAHSPGPGKGSEFAILLPLLYEARPDEERVTARPLSALPAGQLGARARESTHKILIVEDNVDSASSLAELLEMLGQQVRAVHDGPAALEAALAFCPDIILLDIGLPGMNGYEVARRLRREPALEGATLVALTGYGQEEDRRKAIEAGFDRHFIKPVDPGALQSLLGQSA